MIIVLIFPYACLISKCSFIKKQNKATSSLDAYECYKILNSLLCSRKRAALIGFFFYYCLHVRKREGAGREERGERETNSQTEVSRALFLCPI